MEDVEREIQDLISQAQHLLQKAEVRSEKLMLHGARRYKLDENLDTVQRLLVEAQLSFVEDKEGEELLGAFFHGPVADQCQVEWNQDDRLLKIFIPDSWERIDVRPSIYIKDILKYRNASEVRYYFTQLLHGVLDRAHEHGALVGFQMFEQCYAGFLFHFQDRYVRDPNNFMVKILIDAAKNSGLFLSDGYQNLIHFAGGVRDENRSGLTMYFTDTTDVVNQFLTDLELIKNGKNHMHPPIEKPHAYLKNDVCMGF